MSDCDPEEGELSDSDSSSNSEQKQKVARSKSREEDNQRERHRSRKTKRKRHGETKSDSTRKKVQWTEAARKRHKGEKSQRNSTEIQSENDKEKIDSEEDISESFKEKSKGFSEDCAQENYDITTEEILEKVEGNETEKTEKGGTLSHVKVMEICRQTLGGLIADDTLLNDLPNEVTLEEVNSQIALEYGQAMTVRVLKADGEVMPVVIEQKATVLDLKRAVQRYCTLKLSREGRRIKISWKYIWKTYWLCFEGEKLKEDSKKIKDYGIGNRDELTFVKKLNEKIVN